MNASIYGMNHSPKTQERESEPLARENDINVLHQELCGLIGDEAAKTFYATNCQGLHYETKCALYVREIDRICESMPVIEVAALIAMVDDDEAQHDLCRANMDIDPQRADDEEAMREETALDNYADGRRLAKAGPL